MTSAMIDVAHAAAHQRHQGQRQQDGRNRHQPVHHAHHHGVDPPVEADHQAERGAEREAHHGHRGAHRQRDPRAVDGARVDVAAEMIGAEPALGRRRAQPLDRLHLLRIARPPERRGHRRHHHQRQGERTGHEGRLRRTKRARTSRRPQRQRGRIEATIEIGGGDGHAQYRMRGSRTT
jgi:hypothetical protein